MADCDVEEPNAYLFFPERTLLERKECHVPVPVIDESKCTHCGKCSDSLRLSRSGRAPRDRSPLSGTLSWLRSMHLGLPEKAVSEGSRSVGEIFRARSDGVEIIWGELRLGEARTTPLIKAVKDRAGGETVIVDCPPGTSCSLVESVRGTDFCLLVTEPTPFGLYDLDIALKVLEKMNIPCGVLVNKSGMGDRKVYEYLEKRNIPLLMEIPLDRKIAELYSRGEIFAEKMPEWKAKFAGMVEEN